MNTYETKSQIEADGRDTPGSRATRPSGLLFVISLGLPLTVVGVSAMAISYATLIDVARVNGLPLPELFPVVIDVGTVACMIAAAQFRLRGLHGGWLAYLTFAVLSAVSVAANGFHAMLTADFSRTAPVIAVTVAAAPPLTLLAITHLVMRLVPERSRHAAAIQAQPVAAVTPSTKTAPAGQLIEGRDKEHGAKDHAAASEMTAAGTRSSSADTAVSHDPGEETVSLRRDSATDTGGREKQPKAAPNPHDSRSETPNSRPPVFELVSQDSGLDEVEAETVRRVAEHIAQHGERPTGKQVGQWLGKSPKTGLRFMAKHFTDDDTSNRQTPIARIA